MSKHGTFDNEVTPLPSLLPVRQNYWKQVAGFLAQIFTILVSIPMVAIATKAQGIHSYLEVDWLHFIESIMFWASIHVQCVSFRQAVLSVENGNSLPVRSESILASSSRC